MAVRITCYGGANAIGGNKILLEADGVGLFFDFGIDYGLWGKFFEEYLKPRSRRGLTDLLELGLLPPLRGLYRPDLELAHEDVWERVAGHPHLRRVEPQAVLLSHAHLDHSAYISFLRGDIPIHTSAATAFLAKAIQDTAQADFEKEVCYLVPRQETDGLLQSTLWNRSPARQRPFVVVDRTALSTEALQFWSQSPGGRALDPRPLDVSTGVGGLAVKHFPVDHSIPGPGAFAVETSVGWVVYSGDIRTHGKAGQLTREFAEAAARLHPAVLLCEGTHVGGTAPVTEEAVHQRALEVVREESHLVIADFGPRNLERLLTFRDIARECGRRLLVVPRDVYLLEALRHVMPEIPDPRVDDTLAVYAELKKADKWEEQIRDRYRRCLVTPRDLRRDQAGYVCCFSFLDINELIDVRPEPGGLYLYSSSEAYGEEQRIDIRRLLNWLEFYGLRSIGVPDPTTGRAREGGQGLHASGHATGPDLLDVVRTISPRVLVPIHTEHPEFYVQNLRGASIEVRVPTVGVPLEF